MKFGSGEIVHRQGDDCTGMFCLLEGQVESSLSYLGREHRISFLHQGDIFGEVGFVGGRRRPMTARVREDATLLSLTSAALSKLQKRNPALAFRLLANLFKVQSARYTELSESRAFLQIALDGFIERLDQGQA